MLFWDIDWFFVNYLWCNLYSNSKKVNLVGIIVYKWCKNRLIILSFILIIDLEKIDECYFKLFIVFKNILSKIENSIFFWKYN